MGFSETVGGLAGAIGGGAVGGGAGATAGGGIGAFIGGLLDGPAPGVEFWRQMEGNGWAADVWAQDYGKWLERYKPATWASGDIWDNWPEPSPFRQAWNAAGGVPLGPDLQPLDPAAAGNTGGGGTSKDQKGGGGAVIWYWPWDKDAFKLAGTSVMLAWAGIFIGVPLLIWALFFRRSRKTRRSRRSV